MNRLGFLLALTFWLVIGVLVWSAFGQQLYPNQLGGLKGSWLGGNNSSSGAAPPTCSNKLDFSVACNSQYLLAIGF